MATRANVGDFVRTIQDAITLLAPIVSAIPASTTIFLFRWLYPFLVVMYNISSLRHKSMNKASPSTLLKLRGTAMFTVYCQLISDCRLIGCWVAGIFYSRKYMHRLVRFAVPGFVSCLHYTNIAVEDSTYSVVNIRTYSDGFRA